MCSVIEIKNNNEYYIHYHSPDSLEPCDMDNEDNEANPDPKKGEPGDKNSKNEDKNTKNEEHIETPEEIPKDDNGFEGFSISKEAI